MLRVLDHLEEWLIASLIGAATLLPLARHGEAGLPGPLRHRRHRLLLITAPILFSVAMKLGIDPIPFGVMVTVNMEIGMIQ